MRIFQTFVLPDELVIRHRLSFAAANFSRNLISGGGFDKVYSLIPVNVRGELGIVTESGYEVIYSGWRKKCRILAKVAIFAEQWKMFRQIHNGDSVWFYNMNMINGYLFLLLYPLMSFTIILQAYLQTADSRKNECEHRTKKEVLA